MVPSLSEQSLSYVPWPKTENVVRGGSRRFDVLEPHPTSAYSTLTPSIPFKDAGREGSVQSNHPELV